MMKRDSIRINVDIISASIATLALVVSLTTLWLARRTDQRDAFYREVGIRPALNVFSDSYDRAITLENVGIGPAIFRRMLMRIDNLCIDSAKSDNWIVDQNRFYKKLFQYVADEFNRNTPEIIRARNLAVLRMRHDSIGLDEIISVGQKRQISSFYVDYATSRDDLLNKYKYDGDDISRQAFTKYRDQYLFVSDYCSITRQYRKISGINIKVKNKCEQTIDNDNNISCVDGIIIFDQSKN